MINPASRHATRWAPALAVLLPVALLALVTSTRIRFDGAGQLLADEGYLWYGAQRVFAGEVPLRDFASYEPGRYYWTAAWMWLARDHGVFAERWASAAFEAVVLGVIAAAVWRRSRSVATSVLTASSCMLLMYTWHGRFEPSVALLQAVVLARLCESPTPSRFFAGGLQAGLATLFGRNLALYGAVGLLGVIAVLWLLDERRVRSVRLLVCAAAGVFAGIVPLGLMALLVPEFAAAFWQSIIRHFELGTTNLTLPVPWPWRLSFDGMPGHIALGWFLYGACFVVLPLLGVAIVGWAVRNRRLLAEQPLFAAAAILSIPYVHYVFSRPDMEHLARGGAPMVLALSLVPLGRWRVAPAIVVVASLLLVPDTSPERWMDERSSCKETQVGDARLCVSAFTAATVDGARAIVERFVRPGESVLIAPHHPGLYSALGLRSPIWDTYPLFPVGRRAEEADIARLQQARTRVAIVSMIATDQRAELRFDATHPRTAAYLADRFALVRQQVLPEMFVVLARP